jgi:hypothetical protein
LHWTTLSPASTVICSDGVDRWIKPKTDGTWTLGTL